MGLFKSKEQKRREAEAKERERKTSQILGDTTGTLDPHPYIAGNAKKKNDKIVDINRSQEQLRDLIKEEAVKLYKQASVSFDDPKVGEQVQELIQRIPRLELGMEPNITAIIVQFFVDQIRSAIREAQEKNIAAVSIAVFDLDGMLSEIADPRTSAILFANESYVKQRTRLAKLRSEKESLEGALQREREKVARLVELHKAGSIGDVRFKSEREAIAANAASIQTKIKQNQDILATLELTVRQLRQELVNSAKEQETDIAIAEDILDMKEETESRSADYVRVREGFKSDGTATSTSDMHIKDASADDTKLSDEQKEKLYEIDF